MEVSMVVIGVISILFVIGVYIFTMFYKDGSAVPIVFYIHCFGFLGFLARFFFSGYEDTSRSAYVFIGIHTVILLCCILMCFYFKNKDFKELEAKQEKYKQIKDEYNELQKKYEQLIDRNIELSDQLKGRDSQ